MAEKYLSIDLNDPRSGRIAEALANPTCKKILNLIADGEMNATDLALKLNIPLNTVMYNIDKLVESGLIENSNKMFWSAKGKKINSYRVSNKRIVISPKSLSGKGIIPAIIGSVVVTSLIKYLTSNKVYEISSFGNVQTAVPNVANEIAEKSMDYASTTASSGMSNAVQYLPGLQNSITPVWAWFLLGSFVAILIFLLWNLLNMKGGK